MNDDMATGLMIGAAIGAGLGLLYAGHTRRTTLAAVGALSVPAAASTAAAGSRARDIRPVVTPGEPVGDDVLLARAQVHLERIVSEPEAIMLSADNGRLTLGGTVDRDEAAELVSCLSWIRGVTAIENRLTPSDDHGHEAPRV